MFLDPGEQRRGPRDTCCPCSEPAPWQVKQWCVTLFCSYMARSPRGLRLSMVALIDDPVGWQQMFGGGGGTPRRLDEISSRGPPRLCHDERFFEKKLNRGSLYHRPRSPPLAFRQMCHERKGSERANILRFAPNSGGRADIPKRQLYAKNRRGAKAGMMSGRTPSQRPDVGQLDCQPLR